jgi:hypothetical protein
LAAGAPGAAAPAANPYLPFGGSFFGGAAYLAASALPGIHEAQQQSDLLAMAAATRTQQKLQEAKQHDQQLSKLISFQQQTAAEAADPNTAAGGRGGGPEMQPVPNSRSTGSIPTGVSRLTTSTIAAALRLLLAAIDDEAEPAAATVAAAAAPLQHAASSTSSQGKGVIWNFPVEERMYTPKPMNLHVNSSSSRCLITIDQDKADIRPERSAFAIQLRDGTWIKPSKVVDDSGCTPELWAEQSCLRLGMPFTRCTTPEVLMIDKTPASIVGVTDPHWVMLGGSTDCPLKVWRPGGALVLAGDAGGMFDLCIGTETLKEFFSHTNPLHQHLCWYPDAQNGDVRRVNGVPVTIFAGASLAAALQGSSAVPARHFAAAFQFSAAAAKPAAAPAAEIEDLFAVVTPEQQLRAGQQSLQTLVQQVAEQITVSPAATTCSSIPTLLTLAAADWKVEPDSLPSAPSVSASADPLPLLTFSDGSVRDPLLTPAAAKAAALQRNQHRLISMSRLMQQCWVFLLLLGAALLAGPVAAAPKPAAFLPAEMAELQRQLSLRAAVSPAEGPPDISISGSGPVIYSRRFRCCRHSAAK